MAGEGNSGLAGNMSSCRFLLRLSIGDVSFWISIGDVLGPKQGEEREDEDEDEDGEFDGDFVSLFSGALGSHESSVGKAAGGRFGLNWMTSGCKDGWIRVLAGGGRGGGGEDGAGL